MSFINDDFLLGTETARALYHGHAAAQPIIDYHCHLPPQDVAEDRRFANLYEIWLEGDHYKWRLMRTNGLPERLCTGDADPKEKFLAFARTVPMTLRNPMYHWCHLELQRYFGIDLPINEANAEEIWHRANEQLADPAFSARGILKRFNVEVVCTTDDPADDLPHHRAIAAAGIRTKIYPTYRPDKALGIGQPDAWNAWVDHLADTSGQRCESLEGFLAALKSRHDAFHEAGGRLSDHGLTVCPATYASEHDADLLFLKARAGDPVSDDDAEAFAGYLMLQFGHWDADKSWTKQLHLGALRNNNTRLFRSLGRDIGCDSIGDWPQAEPLSRYLDRLDQANALPKTVLYNLNPTDNYLFASMIGNFQDGSIAGKVQFGSGWWFNDQIEGMTWQLNALSNLGLLGRFVGMLTDSRSFLSYCRHEYFRRLLCRLLGEEVEQGLLPRDEALLGALVEDICYGNASRFFGFQLPEKTN